MPPRLSLRPLVSACRSCTAQAKAFISSNGPRAAPQFTDSNASRDLLDVDNSKHGTLVAVPRSQRKDAAHLMLDRTIRNTKALGGAQTQKEDAYERSKATLKRQEIGHYMSRKWATGDVYSPHDLSPAEMKKWKSPKRPTKDIIDILGINPLDHYKNFAIISEYMTEMGRIKPSKMTGLRPVNQRKMAKAIRRAIGMGIHPSTHRHPMILYSLEDLKDFVDIKAKLTRQKPE